MLAGPVIYKAHARRSDIRTSGAVAVTLADQAGTPSGTPPGQKKRAGAAGHASGTHVTHDASTEHDFLVGRTDLHTRRCEASRGPSPYWTSFVGRLTPFDALVPAIPGAQHTKRNLQLELSKKPAMFLGYMVQDGGRWLGEVMWALFDDYAD